MSGGSRLTRAELDEARRTVRLGGSMDDRMFRRFIAYALQADEALTKIESEAAYPVGSLKIAFTRLRIIEQASRAARLREEGE